MAAARLQLLDHRLRHYGGWNQSQAHAQFISDIADSGMNIQAAIEAQRFTRRTFGGNDVELEWRFSKDVREELAAKGHQIQLLGSFSTEVG